MSTQTPNTGPEQQPEATDPIARLERLSNKCRRRGAVSLADLEDAINVARRLKAALADACEQVAQADDAVAEEITRASSWERRAKDAEQAVRDQIVDDFITFSRRRDSLASGEAVLIAREGLCRCRGGNKPCQDGGAS